MMMATLFVATSVATNNYHRPMKSIGLIWIGYFKDQPVLGVPEVELGIELALNTANELAQQVDPDLWRQEVVAPAATDGGQSRKVTRIRSPHLAKCRLIAVIGQKQIDVETIGKSGSSSLSLCNEHTYVASAGRTILQVSSTVG